MSRIAAIQKQIDMALEKQTRPLDRRTAYIHTYGVAQACALLAKRREQERFWRLSLELGMPV